MVLLLHIAIIILQMRNIVCWNFEKEKKNFFFLFFFCFLKLNVFVFFNEKKKVLRNLFPWKFSPNMIPFIHIFFEFLMQSCFLFFHIL